MNAFVRRVAALSVLWSLCELLLPEGGTRRAVRMTVSLLVIAALVSGMGELLGDASLPVWPSREVWAQAAADGGYGRTALTALANQAQGFCQRLGERAGYRTQAVVYLRADGSLERAELWLSRRADAAPLMEEEAVLRRVAEALNTEESRVLLMEAGGP